MFVLKPDEYLLPAYRISPFQTADVAFNHLLPEDDSALGYFAERFAGREFVFTINGRKAIHLALGHYGLQKEDLVTILTTSQNFYISSCVTLEIEKFCRWNREITPETKLILVNHEFGYPYQNMKELMALNLPVIEDCCTTFWSQDERGKTGAWGDFAMYSFPKFFPIQIGGLLVNNKKREIAKDHGMGKEEESYILKVLSHYLKKEAEIIEKRQEVFRLAVEMFSGLGFSERFEIKDGTIPSALMLKNNGIVKNLPALKSFLWAHGMQSSVFYGEDAFFIPNHQRLSTENLNYFFSVISNFIKQQKDDHI